MDSTLINQFVHATIETFQMMIGITPSMSGRPYLQQEASSSEEISAIIGLSGHLQGGVALRFGKDVASGLVQAMLKMEEAPLEADVLDGVGEIANIVAGALKGAVGRSDVSISLPQVVLSQGHRLHYSVKMPSLVVPFTCDMGPFQIEVQAIRSA
ncbi:MAG: chemotaxis protein CheX [Planctomycetota bacterium]|jgi:chemotaxis protein CheX|nr:chemotaxis protein CheX [Planctomycetota bacterium]